MGNIFLVALDIAHICKVVIIDIFLMLASYLHNEGKELEIFFSGKTVLITGASSGLGAQLGISLCRLRPSKPVNLILSSRNISGMEEIAQECKSLSPESTIAVIPLDLSAVDNDGKVMLNYIKKLEDTIKNARIEPVSCLINNAGVSSRSTALATSSTVLQEIMQTNFFGPVALTKAIIHHFLENGGSGSIAVVSSVQGLIGIPNRTSYAASKHALQGYFESLRAEIASKDISVTIVSPGYINTALSLNALTGDGSKHGVMDDTTKNGMDACVASKAILLAISRQETDVLLCDAKTAAAVRCKSQFPGLLAKIMKKRAGK